MENDKPMYLETHKSSHKTFVVSKGLTNSTSSFPFFLLLGLLLELGLIVLLEFTCTLDATQGNESKVTSGSPLKNNLN